MIFYQSLGDLLQAYKVASQIPLVAIQARDVNVWYVERNGAAIFDCVQIFLKNSAAPAQRKEFIAATGSNKKVGLIESYIHDNGFTASVDLLPSDSTPHEFIKGIEVSMNRGSKAGPEGAIAVTQSSEKTMIDLLKRVIATDAPTPDLLYLNLYGKLAFGVNGPA